MAEGNVATVPSGLTARQRFAKRAFDIAGAAAGLLLLWWLIVLAWIVASVDTHANGFFVQTRIGLGGRPFPLIKIRTMRVAIGPMTSVTAATDTRIAPVGRVLRRTKIDELPQLINVLVGDMSFVGPRPDVRGFADRLEGDDRVVLAVRPGITGPASLRYRAEEDMLASVADPEAYNRDVIFPEKVLLNKEYVRSWSFIKDLKLIMETVARW
jgi:lipopolysaccharide/colanic/teichoic acid biosynthesis glycosyltransferase